MSIALWDARQSNVPRDDNDLKYRYMKMKGNTSPELMAELEDISRINRDAERIKQMRSGIIGVRANNPPSSYPRRASTPQNSIDRIT